MRNGLWLYILAIISLLLPWHVFAEGFEVEPSIIAVDQVAPGADFELLQRSSGYFLGIKNLSDRECKYRIEISPAKQRDYNYHYGHTDIPDLSWITVKNPEIVVHAKQTGHLRDVFIKIPSKKEYYNQR